jgi:hypothetical protein
MMRVTIDTNCLIDLEGASPNGQALRWLADLASAGRVELRLPAIAASERQLGGATLTDFSLFEQRVHAAGLKSARLIEPICYWDLSFWGHCLFPDTQMSELEHKIHLVLHPTIEFAYPDFCSAGGIHAAAEPISPKWRNAKCDVLVAWSHIHHRGDLLVTSDENFHKMSKRADLIELGAGDLKRPQEVPAALAPAV